MAVIRPCLPHLLPLLCVLLLAPSAASAHEAHVAVATMHEKHVPETTKRQSHALKATKRQSHALKATTRQSHVPDTTKRQSHALNATKHENHVPEAAADAQFARSVEPAVPYLAAQCPGAPGGACCCSRPPASSGSPHVEIAAAGPAWIAAFAARSTEPARDRGAAAPALHPCLTSCRPRAPPAV